MYNLTNITEAKTVLDLYAATDQLSGHLLTMILLVALEIILIVSMSGRHGFRTSLVVGNFIMMIISIMAWLLGFLLWYWAGIFILLFFLGLVMYAITE